MNKLIKELFFYQDSSINKEIAFILNVEYKVISEIKKGELETEKIFVSDLDEINNLSKLGFEENVDFISFSYLYDYLNQFNKESDLNGRNFFYTDLQEIEKIEIKYLSLSEMLIKVLYSKPKDIDCKSIEQDGFIDDNGDIWGCCPHWVGKPFGNFIDDADPYNNYRARIIKLSSINKTFCFCNLCNCKYFDSKNLENYDINIDFKTLDIPRQITIAIDKMCNLRCNSCRKDYYVPTEEAKERSKIIAEKLIASGWLNKCLILLAGQGEVFLSPNYLKILNSPLVYGKMIQILSNGVLFTESKWKLLSKKFEDIYVYISVDAASEETYSKLRHGNFNTLLKNLKMLGKYRKENKQLKYFVLNFVVQKENMNEMIDFIKLAKELNVDKIQFTKMNNWYCMPIEEYNEKSLVIDDYINYDLYKCFQNPIFKDPIVDISCFYDYIENSKKHYN